MIYLIDNYDSFTYNLYQLVGTLTNEPITVIKNDQITANELENIHPSALIFSPGPGRPENAGNMMNIMQAFLGQVPILGVCLGEQAIGELYGAKVEHAPVLMHGKPSDVSVDQTDPLFAQCPKNFEAARYHSLIIDPNTVSANLKITAETHDGEVMAISDVSKKIFGVQFHPESIMTDPATGRQIVQNFLSEI